MKNRVCFSLMLAVLAIPAMVRAQPKNCDFWGTAKVRGVNVGSGDEITAYDTGGQLCGDTTGTSGGLFLIHVKGDESTPPGVDEGAPEGGYIIFKINGERAYVTSGDSIFYNGESYNANINVPDVPPNSAPGGPYTGLEGNPVTAFNGSGSTGAVTYSWTFGDGGTGTGATPSYTYGDNGTYTVSLTVQNGSGQTNTKSTTATISNVAPTVAAINNKTANEGQSVSFSGSATDPAGAYDPLVYNWTFGDGQTGTGQTVNHTYVNNRLAPYNVTLNVTDGDGGTGTTNLTVTVSNVAPQNVDAGSVKTSSEGQSVSFTGSATDPGTEDVLSYSWNFGDGQTGAGKTISHVFRDNGTFTVTLTVSDNDGGQGTDNTTATVSNVAPTAEAGGPYTAVLDLPLQLSGSASDPGSLDVLTYEWDLDNDGQYDDFTGRYPQKTWAEEGIFTVSLKVTDDDAGLDTDDATVTVIRCVPVILQTLPRTTLQLLLDEQTVTAPYTAYLVPGSTHTIEAPRYQAFSSNTRCVYVNWSDGGNRRHTITIGSDPITLTANYRYEYWVEIDEGGKGGSPSGEGWYTPGSKATVFIDTLILDPQGTTRYKFYGWVGTGNAAYTGDLNPVEITVNGPIVERVNWDSEYRLQIVTAHGSPSGMGWYASGSRTHIQIDTLVDEGNGTRYRFDSWQGAGTGEYTGQNNPAMVYMNGPITETVNWMTEYFLDVVSDHGTFTGEDWYNSGQMATVSIDTTVPQTEGTRTRFNHWEGEGNGSYTGPLSSFQVTMTAPIVETAVWDVQFYLRILSDIGNPTGEGWHFSGELVPISVDTAVTLSDSVRYHFSGWVGAGAGSYTGDDPSPGIVILGPVEETAQWDTQYFIWMTVDPPGSGYVTPISAPGGWGNADEVLRLTAVGYADSGYGFFNWSGDTSGIANPLDLAVDSPKNLTVHFAKGSVIILTRPTGMQIKVDGATFVAPVVTNWQVGARHMLEADSLQGDGVTTMYHFDAWSDLGARKHEVFIGEIPKTITADFSASYFVGVQSDFGTPTGGGWCVEGTTVRISVDSLVMESEKVRRKFTGWSGSGEGSYTGTNRTVDFTVLGPVVEQAQWAPQFKVETKTIPSYAPSVSLTLNPSDPWFDPGDEGSVQVDIGDTSCSFLGWTGDVTGTDNPITFTVQGPMTLIANLDVFNLPPQIVNFPNLVIMEDEEYRVSSDSLGQYILDPNEPMEFLNLEFSAGSHLEARMDSVTREMVVSSELNWNGVEPLTLIVIDGWGASDTASCFVTVLPVDDPPGSFGLASPPNDTAIGEWLWPMEFTWHKSWDLDSGDSINYTFYYSPSPNLSGPGTIAVSFLTDTTLFLNVQNNGDFYWAVWAEDGQKNRKRCEDVFRITIQTAVEEGRVRPTDYGLVQNFPNPFNPRTTVRFDLPASGRVSLVVLDVTGRVVRRLVDAEMEAGRHDVFWDSKNDYGEDSAAGLYIVRMQAGTFAKNVKMLLVR